MTGLEGTPIEALREADGFAVAGERPSRLEWNAVERGWILRSASGEEAGRTTIAAGVEREAIAPASILLADGRLFRLAAIGASTPRWELSRWDGPGAYLVARAVDGGWEIERTAAGDALTAGPELWLLTAAEIGRLDGWW